MITQEEIMEFATRTLNRFNQMAKVVNYPVDRLSYITGLDGPEGINFEGDEYWSFGGHGHHYYTLDWKYFLCSDEEFPNLLKEFEEEVIEEKRIEKILKEKREQEELDKKEAKEKALFNQLKTKYDNTKPNP